MKSSGALWPIALIACLCACDERRDAQSDWLATASSHPATPIELPSYWMYDLGVVDANDDGLKDLYTTAHMSRDAVMINNGRSFVDQLTPLGLDSIASVPWLESMDQPPEKTEPGLYLWMHQDEIHLKLVRLDSAKLVLSFDYPGEDKFKVEPVTVVKSRAASVEVSKEVQPDGDVRVVTSISLTKTGRVRLKNTLTSLLMRADLVTPTDPGLLRLGFQGTPAKNWRTQLRWRDRHGWAWTHGQSGRPTVYIANGGLKNTIRLYSSHAWVNDEYLSLGLDGRFASQYEDAGFVKGNCRTYKVMFVDVNGDNRDDLTRSCVGGGLELLFGNAQGRFSRPRNMLAVATKAGDQFQWFDADRDGDLDVVFEADNSISVATQTGGAFGFQKILESVDVERLAIGDYDNDLDVDVIAFLKDAPTQILTNSAGTFTPQSTDKLGLPHNGATGGWVDADLDGDLDYHDVPNGLYLRQGDGSYLATELFAHADALQPNLVSALSAWFDAESDGRWDVVLATYGHIRQPIHDRRRAQRPREISLGGWWETSYRNIPNVNQWIGLSLTGSRGSPAGAGATIYLRSGSDTRAHVVGEQDFSHFSQGNYDLLLGLGAANEASSVTVVWPDGNCQRVGPLAANQWHDLSRSELTVC